MQGAREYAQLFKTGQYGNLYLVSGSHARGHTFNIFVLPAGCVAKPNGPNNPPLNKDAVEVFGVTGGNPGWTEYYGWMHMGKWQDDFAKLVDSKKAGLRALEASVKEAAETKKIAEERRNAELLAAY